MIHPTRPFGNKGLTLQLRRQPTGYTAPTQWWISQLVGLRLAGNGGVNTQALTAPTGLTAAALSSSQVQLSWTASTDKLQVSGYMVERCAGSSSCTNFTFVGSVTSGTTYTDSALSPSTTYTYRVRAYDTANLLSQYTAAVSVATPGS